MAQTADEEELKIMSQIHAMEEGEMKYKLLETFMNQIHSSSSCKASTKKPIFVDASYELKTKAFQRDQLQSKFRALTLGEVSREIHNLKTKISTLKHQVA